MAKGRVCRIEALSRQKATVYLEGGDMLPITNWFDERGNECDPKAAVMCVAGKDGFGWIDIDLRDFERMTVH